MPSELNISTGWRGSATAVMERQLPGAAAVLGEIVLHRSKRKSSQKAIWTIIRLGVIIKSH